MKKERIGIDEAAELLGCSKQFLRVALQRKVFPFGCAVKMTGDRYTYYINRSLLKQYVNGEKAWSI
jgi:excisionase family DNA binding protein